MNWRWLAVVATGVALLGVSVSEPALAAKAKKKMRVAQNACADSYGGPTWRSIWFNGEPLPNGCAPPVYYGSRYIGQDPDPFIRQQLLRQPETGFTITR